MIVNMLEAKNSLSKLVEDVASGRETEITIARHGKPAARLVALKRTSVRAARRRIGVARGKFVVPESIDASAEEAAALFMGSSKPSG